MDCKLIQPDLVSYHFGMIEVDARERVEKHLLECPQCLRDYIALKREMETTEERPSPAAKARLREAVAREVGRRVTWSWWERPLAVAFAAVAILTAGSMVHALATSDGRPPRTISNP
jgi:anti-sigma factor RsiW